MAISNPVRTGISFGREFGGLIPAFEEREVARFALYNWIDWLQLDPTERAACVAHYRLSNMVTMHSEDAVSREIKRRMPSPGGGP